MKEIDYFILSIAPLSGAVMFTILSACMIGTKTKLKHLIFALGIIMWLFTFWCWYKTFLV